MKSSVAMRDPSISTASTTTCSSPRCSSWPRWCRFPRARQPPSCSRPSPCIALLAGVPDDVRGGGGAGGLPNPHVARAVAPCAHQGGRPAAGTGHHRAGRDESAIAPEHGERAMRPRQANRSRAASPPSRCPRQARSRGNMPTSSPPVSSTQVTCEESASCASRRVVRRTRMTRSGCSARSPRSSASARTCSRRSSAPRPAESMHRTEPVPAMTVLTLWKNFFWAKRSATNGNVLQVQMASSTRIWSGKPCTKSHVGTGISCR
mgnify:CR=1 FL=1